MRYSFLLLLSLLSFSIFGQAVKSKKIRFKNSKQVKEQFYVLKKNKKIKHGSYESFFYNGNPAQSGHYKNNLKDGKWVYCKPNGQIKAVEHYTTGKKSGIWSKFIESGQVIQRFDYDQNKALAPLFNITIAYPPASRDAGIEGLVKFHVEMDENCEVKNIKLLQSLNQECDKLARKALERAIYLRKTYLPDNCAFEDNLFSLKFSLD